MNQRELALLVGACTDSICILQDAGASDNLILAYQLLRAKLMAMQAKLPLPELNVRPNPECED